MEDSLPKTYSKNNFIASYLNDLVTKYDHFLLDWDGVIYSGGAAIEGSVEAIKYIRKHGKSLYFITNSSGRSQKGLKEKLAKLGVDIEVKEALPSWLTPNLSDKIWNITNYTTAIYLKDAYPDIKKVYVIGERGLMDQLELEGIKCIGGADETEVSMTPEEYENYKLDEEVGAVVVGYISIWCLIK